jgi:hypothetical protein
MYAINLDEFQDKGDRKKALIISAASITVLLILTYFITFSVHPAVPVDIPPLNSDEVIEEFMLDNAEVLKTSEGGGGGGTPSDAPLDEPKAQSREYLTSTNSDTKVFSGHSQNHNSDHGTNQSSTTSQSDNPFASGGQGGKEGAGKGPFGGIGNGGEGEDGPGNGSGGGTRIRLNDPVLPQYNTNFDSKVYLQLTINGNGEVVNAKCIKSKTTCSDQSIINDVIRNVIKQTKYKKDPTTALAITYLTVDIDAQ